MDRDSFIIYKSFYKPISKLSDKQLGRLFRAIFMYQLGEVVTVEEDIEMAFEFFKNQFEIDESKYQGTVERNRENGRKGGAYGKLGGRPRKDKGQTEPPPPKNPQKPRLGLKTPLMIMIMIMIMILTNLKKGYLTVSQRKTSFLCPLPLKKLITSD